jgi:threonine synthase
MRFVSTRGQSPPVSFREALLNGLAPDGGLYMPASLDRLPPDAFRDCSLLETGQLIGAAIIGDEVPAPALSRVLADALNFPVPLVALGDRLYVLELFHGPTFAFKDVGARVMARLMAYVNDTDRPLTILVATSGDTGSAVAQAFFGVPGTQVVVLFPEGAVTPVQEAQFTTLGGNVRAVGVAGRFDDCQRLAKEAFGDPALADVRLTSANSINIGRLVPQAFYYAYVAGQLAGRRVAFSVPSGNVGNLTAGLLAWALGAPIDGFIAATTINDTFARYLETGRYEPRPSVPTLANAMDVGNPSNVERLRALFDDVEAMRRMISAVVYTDADVVSTIRRVYDEYGYVCDPHSAIGYLGTSAIPDDTAKIFLSTAHPAKFRETVEPAIGRAVPLPAALAEALAKPRFVHRIPPSLPALRDLLRAAADERG